MKTAFLTLIGLAAFLALVLLAMWAEARVRLVDLVGFILAAVGAASVWFLVYHILKP
jgi:uncharacterized membrane protein